MVEGVRSIHELKYIRVTYMHNFFFIFCNIADIVQLAKIYLDFDKTQITDR